MVKQSPFKQAETGSCHLNFFLCFTATLKSSFLFCLSKQFYSFYGGASGFSQTGSALPSKMYTFIFVQYQITDVIKFFGDA